MSERIPFEPGFKLSPETPGPSWMIDADGHVHIRCLCGRVIGSPSLHAIAADGTVTASVLHHERDSHPNGPCDWHTFVTLDGWIDGDLPAASIKIASEKLRAVNGGRS